MVAGLFCTVDGSTSKILKVVLLTGSHSICRWKIPLEIQLALVHSKASFKTKSKLATSPPGLLCLGLLVAKRLVIFQVQLGWRHKKEKWISASLLPPS